MLVHAFRSQLLRESQLWSWLPPWDASRSTLRCDGCGNLRFTYEKSCDQQLRFRFRVKCSAVRRLWWYLRVRERHVAGSQLHSDRQQWLLLSLLYVAGAAPLIHMHLLAVLTRVINAASVASTACCSRSATEIRSHCKLAYDAGPERHSHLPVANAPPHPPADELMRTARDSVP
jgi:hypothetical protein